MNIGFIGYGNMAAAMVGGIVSAGLCAPEAVFLYDTDPAAMARAAEQGLCPLDDISAVAAKAPLVFLAVKPQFCKEPLAKLRDCLSPQHTLLSIMAGKSLAFLAASLAKDQPIVRIMPNTPALVCAGMSAISCNPHVSESVQADVLRLCKAFGKAEMVSEDLMDAVVAVSGSAPAYCYLFIEAMADAAVSEGMPRSQAYTFAAQTMLGSAKTVLETGLHPGLLKDMVCSPGGTTIEAVRALESGGLRSTVMDAMKACADRSRALAHPLGD